MRKIIDADFQLDVSPNEASADYLSIEITGIRRGLIAPKRLRTDYLDK
jgi:hypothetical protein